MNSQANPLIIRILTRKAAIETRISEELKRPLPDSLKLQRLKRARLSLKDRLTGLVNARRRDFIPGALRTR